MSTDNNKPKHRLTFYHFLLWLLVGIQFSAHVLNHITPEADRTGVSLVNAWIGIGTCFSDNWSAFTVITILGCVGVYLYKHLMNEKFTLQDALSYLVAVLANVFFFLKAWDVNAWTEKWDAVNKAPISFMIWTLITVGITVAVHAFIKSRQAYAEFEQKVLPTLNEADETEQDGKTKVQSQSEIEFRMKHPIIHHIRTNELQKDKVKRVKDEIHLQRLEFQKKQDEQLIQFAQELQQKKIDNIKVATEDDLKSYIKEGKRLGNLEPEEEIESRNATRLAFLLTALILVIFLAIIYFDNDNIPDFFRKLAEGLSATNEWLQNIEPTFKTLISYLGVPFLALVILMVIYLTFYTAIRAYYHSKRMSSKDKSNFKDIWTLTKCFFFGTLQGIFRPLLFLPDFLEVVEEFLLETDLQEKIDEYNKEDD